ncbi:MAG: hypothetical protein HY740_01960 [Chloroflexi bacterium]|nr:hypothetical protein [Chloroflexota bacterium]
MKGGRYAENESWVDHILGLSGSGVHRCRRGVFVDLVWGVYGLLAVWLVTALAYLLFAFPVWHLPIAGMIVIGAFVILIRPVWKRLV